MRGHVQRRNGRYRAQVYIGRGPDGKPKYRNKTFDRKRDAEAWLGRIIQEIEGSIWMDAADMTVGQWLHHWLDHYVRGRLAPKTVESYEIIACAHLIPALGHIRLPKLRGQVVQSYYSQALKSGNKLTGEGLSPRTVLHHHTCLHKAMRDAVRAGYIAVNPVDMAVPPKPIDKEIRPYTPHELQRILAAARSTSYYLPVAVGIHTGMRRGEVLGLQWGDIDFERGVIHVQRSMEQGKGPVIRLKDPKTAKSRRSVPIPELLLSELTGIRQGKPDDALVMVWPDGSPITPLKLSHMFAYIRGRAGLAHGTYHTLRHSYATILLTRGVNPKVVQELLGHSTITTTMNTYSHVVPALLAQAVEIFTDSLVEGSAQLLATGNLLDVIGEDDD